MLESIVVVLAGQHDQFMFFDWDLRCIEQRMFSGDAPNRKTQKHVIVMALEQLAVHGFGDGK
jgi:hypothetical protein